MSEGVKVLIVDDEEDILEFLEYNLSKAGYTVRTASDGEKGLQAARTFMPHLIILDIMMPGLDGIEVCEQLRADENQSDTLIAFLTARNESFTQISALEMGGDDFINKPIKPSVLTSRVKALLRRHPSLIKKKKSTETFGNLVVNFENFTVEMDGKSILLAKKEFDLLTLLTSKPGKVFKRVGIFVCTKKPL